MHEFSFTRVPLAERFCSTFVCEFGWLIWNWSPETLMTKILRCIFCCSIEIITKIMLFPVLGVQTSLPLGIFLHLSFNQITWIVDANRLHSSYPVTYKRENYLHCICAFIEMWLFLFLSHYYILFHFSRFLFYNVLFTFSVSF